jgi:hypothetical protein
MTWIARANTPQQLVNFFPILKEADTGTSTLKDVLIHAIWDNPYAVYSNIRTEISGAIERRKRQESLDTLSPLIIPDLPKETVQEPISW